MSLRNLASSCALLLALCGCSSSTDGSSASAPPPSTPPPSATTDPSPPPPDPQREACDAETVKLKAGLDKAHVKTAGAVLAVKNEACGLRVLTSGPKELTDKQLHRIGSVTKTYVGAVILLLAKEGALSIEDSIAKFDLGVPNADAITVRHLLSHQSGIFNYTEDQAFLKEAVSSPDKTYTPAELVAVATKHAPNFEPGKGWHYSNTNFVLLGMIAEKVGKAKIGALVRQRVLSKIGASATFFDGEEPVGGDLATGLSSNGSDLTHAFGPSWAWAAGAIVASPSDAVLWIEKLGAGTFHDPDTQKALLTTVTTDASVIRYGLAIMVFDRSITMGFGPGIGHGGDIPGFHTQAFYFPEKKTTVVSIVDSDADNPNDVTVAALTALGGKK